MGSNTFLPEAWNRFVDWLAESDASYLLIAGDLVDGIGVFPGQEQELTIKNIYEQYDAFGDLISAIPHRIKIIAAPGNHDVVRGAEPQPVIPEQFTKKFPENCMLVENPALVNLQGVRVLMYHGRSIDDMIGLIPGASYEQSGRMMEEMLQRRHLAPCVWETHPDCRRKVRPSDHRPAPGDPAHGTRAYPGADKLPRGARGQRRYLAVPDRVPEADEREPDPGAGRHGRSPDTRARDIYVFVRSGIPIRKIPCLIPTPPFNMSGIICSDLYAMSDARIKPLGNEPDHQEKLITSMEYFRNRCNR